MKPAAASAPRPTRIMRRMAQQLPAYAQAAGAGLLHGAVTTLGSTVALTGMWVGGTRLLNIQTVDDVFVVGGSYLFTSLGLRTAQAGVRRMFNDPARAAGPQRTARMAFAVGPLAAFGLATSLYLSTPAPIGPVLMPPGQGVGTPQNDNKRIIQNKACEGLRYYRQDGRQYMHVPRGCNVA